MVGDGASGWCGSGIEVTWGRRTAAWERRRGGVWAAYRCVGAAAWRRGTGAWGRCGGCVEAEERGEEGLHSGGVETAPKVTVEGCIYRTLYLSMHLLSCLSMSACFGTCPGTWLCHCSSIYLCPCRVSFLACKTSLSEMKNLSVVNLWRVAMYSSERDKRSVNMQHQWSIEQLQPQAAKEIL